MQGLKGQGLCEGEMTSHIWIMFFRLLNSLTYFRIISWPCVSLCEALLSFFRRDRNLEISFLLNQGSENGQTDLSVYKFRILIEMEMKKDLFLGSLLYILLQAYPIRWKSSAECSSITLMRLHVSSYNKRVVLVESPLFFCLLNSATSLISGCLLDEGESRSCVFQVIF